MSSRESGRPDGGGGERITQKDLYCNSVEGIGELPKVLISKGVGSHDPICAFKSSPPPAAAWRIDWRQVEEEAGAPGRCHCTG